MKYRVTIVPKTRQTRDVEAESMHAAVAAAIESYPGAYITDVCELHDLDGVEAEGDGLSIIGQCVCGEPILEGDDYTPDVEEDNLGALCAKCSKFSDELSEALIDTFNSPKPDEK